MTFRAGFLLLAVLPLLWPGGGTSADRPAPLRLSDKGNASAPAVRRAPDFTLSDTRGKKTTLSQFRGKVVMLDFWATWCPPCRMSTPVLEKIHQDLAARGVVVLGVSLDEDPASVIAFMKEQKINYPVLMAGTSGVADAYRVQGIPAFFLLNQNGQLVQKWVGYAPSFEEEWRRNIQALLNS